MSNHITRNGPVASNVERVSRLDIPGGGQVEVNGDYAYVGHMEPPHGTSIVDVSDPRKPRLVSKIDLPGDDTHTHKVRIVGDTYMIVNSERYKRHFFRKGKLLPETRVKLEHTLGRPANCRYSRSVPPG